MKPIAPDKGYFYIRKNRAKGSWSLYYETYERGKRKQTKVPELNYSDLGFKKTLTLEEAQKRCKRVNRERRFQKEEIKARINAAENLLKLESLDQTLFPEEYVQAFSDQLDADNFGSEAHLKKLYNHFNFVQKMMIELRLTPSLYKENARRVFKYFIKKKISLSYSRKLISTANRWGAFVSKQEGRYFDPMPIPKNREGTAISSAQKTKSGKSSELGVRTASESLSPEALESAKDSFLDIEHYNFLYITLWFGLRPYEAEMLHDEKKWSVVRDKGSGVLVLKVYQTKLMSVEEDKRYKYIPILFKEQQQALKLIRKGVHKRPHPKTVRKHLKANITLYGGRKGFTDLMLNREQKLEDISLWLGHKNITTTWKHYKDKELVKFVKTKLTLIN